MKRTLVFRSVFFFLVGAFALFSSISCNIGMGESVDLTAPTLTITYPRHGALTPKNITIKGTASDDRKLVGVEVQYKYKKNGETITGSKMAKIDGTDWSCDFVFDGDYEVEFEAFAYDVNRNGSDYSHERVMILIDSENPGVNKMSIVRGNYVARIIDLEEFIRPGDGKTALKNESQNKDYFQNEYITILSNLTDKYGIGEVFLDLYEIDPETKAQTLVKKDIAPPPSNTNKYSPEFEITESMFSSLPAGKVHYIMPHLRVKDEAGNFSDRVDGVFAWEPEYNTPHVFFNAIQNGEIQVPQGAPIIVSVFDDDDLKEYKAWLVKRDWFDSNGGIAGVTALGAVAKESFGSGMRSTAFEVNTEITDNDSNGKAIELGEYVLVVQVIDESNTNRGRSDGVYLEPTPVRITNQDAPTIFVKSDGTYNNPATENSVPQLTDGKFNFYAEVRDNEENVKIAMAWLGPNAGSTQISKFETYFKGEYSFAGTNQSGLVTNGGKIWDIPTVMPTSDGSNYVYHFEKVFDFFNDFPGDKNTPKVFMIAAKDPTMNITTQTFRYNKMPSSISIKVEHKLSTDANTGSYEEDKNPLVTLDPNSKITGNSNYYFKITPQAENGIKITSAKVTPTPSTSGHTAIIHDANYVFTFEIPKANATAGKTMEFDLSATDQLGGDPYETKLTILFDTTGVLQSIDCNSDSGKTFKCSTDEYDGKIKLQANFSGKVNLRGDTSSVYIQLKGDTFKYKNNEDVPAEKRRAEYVSGNQSNTLYFEYKVPEDIEATNITIVESADGPITLNDAKLEGEQKSNVPAGYNKVNDKHYAIDSIAPYITEYSPKKGQAVTKNADGSVDIVLTFNEKVSVESGTIVMQRADPAGGKWYIPPVLSEDVFTKIWNTATKSGNDSERMRLCGSNDAVIKTSNKSLVAEGPYMQYTNGLKEGTGYDANGNKAVTGCLVPDTTTKFVLAYNYNINDSTKDSVVSKIREVLENHSYHKSEFEATVVNVTDNVEDGVVKHKVKLNVKNSDWVGGLVNGVEYFLTITADAFRDEAYNYFKGSNKKEVENGKEIFYGIAPNEYKFWVGPVATPVIRVNRKTTNAANAAPSSIGRTKYKIDCETPGASISYGTTTEKVAGKTTETENYSVHTWVADIKKTKFDDIGLGTPVTVNGTHLIGDDEMIGDVGSNTHKTAEKIYIKAKATKAAITGLGASEVGKEGAFKTVLHYYYDNGKTANKIFGTDAPEGAAFTAGFPFTQNKLDGEYGYQIPYKGNTGTDFYWVSWQIICDFTLQVRGGSPGGENFQNPADALATYGQYIYCKNKDHYGA